MVIIFSGILIYKIEKDEKRLHDEIYTASNTILEDIYVDDGINIEVQSEIDERNEVIVSNSKDKKTIDKIIAFIKIPKINIFYPVVTETNMENLKVSPARLWGDKPNTEGNFCIIGHNLKNNEQFSNLNKLQIGDSAELTDTGGNTLTYTVYDIYEVSENDLSFTSQKTNGRKELTLVTCTNNSKKRLVLKLRS